MRNARLNAAFLLGATASLLATASQAQEHGIVSPPAEKLLIAGGGVDMRTGRYAFSQTDVSIGGEVGGGLALVRQTAPSPGAHIQPFGNFSHNFDVMLIEKRVDIPRLNYEHGSGQDYRITVRYAGRADTFESQHVYQAFTQVSHRENVRLTFSGDRNAGVVYTYQAPDGTIVLFRSLANRDCDTAYRCVYPSQVTYPDGTRLDLEYEGPTPGTPNTTRLRSVVSTRGYALLLEYGGGGGTWHNVSKACVINLALAPKPADNVCPANALATSSYTYVTGGGWLATATDAAGATWGYSYVQNAGTIDMRFTRPGEQSHWLTNNLGGMVEQDARVEVVNSQVFADGQTYHYQYDNLSMLTAGYIEQMAGGSYFHNGRETVARYGFHRRPRSMIPQANDPNEQTEETFGPNYYQYYELTPGPEVVTDALGRTTTFDYCDPYLAINLPPTDQHRCVVTLLQSYTDPEGIRTYLGYDVFNHVASVRRVAPSQPGQPDLPEIVTSATYADCWSAPKTCAHPSRITDANGNVTERVYSPVHGGILTDTGPAVPTRQADGSMANVRPQTRYEYAQRSAWISNGAGGYLPSATPMWLLVRERLCRSTAASGSSCAGGAADEVITDYDYGPDSGPNNLLLRGMSVTADGGTLRTCYGYDALGRRISETQPAANLASCP